MIQSSLSDESAYNQEDGILSILTAICFLREMFIVVKVYLGSGIGWTTFATVEIVQRIQCSTVNIKYTETDITGRMMEGGPIYLWLTSVHRRWRVGRETQSLGTRQSSGLLTGYHRSSDRGCSDYRLKPQFFSSGWSWVTMKVWTLRSLGKDSDFKLCIGKMTD